MYIGNVPLLTYISYIFDACVPIYLFCSGYGLYKKENSVLEKFKNRCKRILNLMLRFWIIMILTCLVGFFLGMSELYPGTIINFTMNALLIKSSYVGAFWFVQTYVLLVLSFGILYKFVNEFSCKVILPVSLLLYIVAFGVEYLILPKAGSTGGLIVNAIMLYLRSQFSFIVGMIFAKEDFTSKYKLLQKINNKVMILLIFAILILIRGWILRHLIFAPFSAIIIILLLGNYNWTGIGKRIFLFFGRHSTNIWLVHMQFYMIFAPRLIFMSRNVFVIFLTLISLSIISSYIIDLEYRYIKKIFRI